METNTKTPTPRQYFDIQGTKVSLDKLCQMDPAWAANQIRHRDKLETELTAAQAEIAELRKDKERLDWLEKFLSLKASNEIMSPACPVRLSRNHPDWTIKTGCGNLTKTVGCGDHIRLAIDAAMTQGKDGQ